MAIINVFATSDDNYAPYVATTIASIMMYTESTIHFYLIDCDITDNNKNKIKAEETIFENLKVDFVKISVDKIFVDFPIMKHLSVAMYGKYLITNLKSDIKKIIYTDIDVAFVDDIKKLWDEPLEGYTIAAVPSQRYRLNDNYRQLKQQLSIPMSHTYFMSGLMIIDCEKWRSQAITEKLLKKTKELQFMPDQEVLNVLFTNNYKILSVKYCVIYKIFKKCYTNKEIREYMDQQVIVHYPGGGASKPWNNPFLKSAKYFNCTLRYTKFEKDIRLNQLKFILKTLKKKLYRKR